jgi:hypothetical protein
MRGEGLIWIHHFSPMRIRIWLSKIMKIHANQDPQPWAKQNKITVAEDKFFSPRKAIILLRPPRPTLPNIKSLNTFYFLLAK